MTRLPTFPEGPSGNHAPSPGSPDRQSNRRGALHVTRTLHNGPQWATFSRRTHHPATERRRSDVPGNSS
jgi:hypothetical protein